MLEYAARAPTARLGVPCLAMIPARRAGSSGLVLGSDPPNRQRVAESRGVGQQLRAWWGVRAAACAR